MDGGGTEAGAMADGDQATMNKAGASSTKGNTAATKGIAPKARTPIPHGTNMPKVSHGRDLRVNRSQRSNQWNTMSPLEGKPEA